MTPDRIQIYSHPHAGGSLLLNMFRRAEGVYVHSRESNGIEDANRRDGLVSVCKWPLWERKTQEPPDHARVFIVRDCRYAIYSLRRRFAGRDTEDHGRCFTARYWVDVYGRWLEASRNPAEYAIRYTDLFDRQRLADLFSWASLHLVADPLGSYPRWIAGNDMPAPTERPDPSDHLAYRRYQLAQPVQCMDDDTKADYSKLSHAVMASDEYQQIFGG